MKKMVFRWKTCFYLVLNKSSITLCGICQSFCLFKHDEGLSRSYDNYSMLRSGIVMRNEHCIWVFECLILICKWLFVLNAKDKKYFTYFYKNKVSYLWCKKFLMCLEIMPFSCLLLFLKLLIQVFICAPLTIEISSIANI